MPPVSNADHRVSEGASGVLEAMNRRWETAGLTFSGPWSRTELAQLQRVLLALSSGERASLRGTEFSRGGPDADLSGNYAHALDSGRITYHDSAFRTGKVAGSVARPHPDWILFHEIGHAISYGADRLAGVKAHAAQHRFEEAHARLSGAESLHDPAARAALREASRAADEALAAVDLGSNLAHFEAGPGHHPAVSSYGATHVDEAFAEAFAMFKTQPETLRAYDPDLWAYFDRDDHVRDWARLPGGRFEPRSAIEP